MPEQDVPSGATPAGFVSAAGAGLGRASTAINALTPAVNSGALTMTDEAAQQLLSALGTLRDRATDLAGSVDDLDQPLHFGHNWVGYTMDSTLRGAASGQNGSVRPVLTEFAALLDTLQATVARAAAAYQATDDAAGSALGRTGEAR